MTLEKPLRAGARPDSSLNFLLGRACEEKPLWTGLYENVRDVFFAPRLPPLELTSVPIPVPDRMAVKTNPWAVGTSAIINGLLLALVLYLGIRTALHQAPQRVDSHHLDLSDFAPFASSPKHSPSGGGGGGSNDPTVPTVGRLPRFAKVQLTPPEVQTFENPKLAIDPAIEVQPDLKLPNDPTLPNLGVHESASVRLLSGGPGSHGIGVGISGGVGPGDGMGVGQGSDHNVGDNVYTPGGGITNPVPIVTPEAEFSDEARRAKYQGICMISVIIDTHGYPQNPRVVQRLGMGLDEKALEAVSKYRFKPALKDGQPVPVRIVVAVNFRLY
jgi:periplasmic protein TonB